MGNYSGRTPMQDYIKQYAEQTGLRKRLGVRYNHLMEIALERVSLMHKIDSKFLGKSNTEAKAVAGEIDALNKTAIEHENWQWRDTSCHFDPSLCGMARRLAAIPLPELPDSSVPQVQESSALTLPALGLTALGAAACVLGYILKRRCAAKRRDSFGFLSDSERPSLNACELNV